jgi:murein DD-endopeptidase MepM/ murein hydrolase activator NlpD
MTSLAWPLERNRIRRDKQNNAFGMVRNGGTRAHQGWDLLAVPMTPCYAIADGRIEVVRVEGDFGKVIQLEFQHRGQTLYAVYCHLCMALVTRDQTVKRGDQIGYTGNSGNARSMQGEDQHLHFEIRTVRNLRANGLASRLDPAKLYGRAPIGWVFLEDHGQKISSGGVLGLKVPGVNVRESKR